jgi:EmrB/QacA subfamily drug resistance transporter
MASSTSPPTTQPRSPGAGSDAIDRYVWEVAAVVILGAVMSILDTTIVNVAIDNLGVDFHSPLSTIQWVATGYMLALATVIPLTGWAQERFGAKRLWMGAIAAFLAGSALSGLAWSAASLIVFRVLQGFGGGMILPVGQSMLAQAAGPRRLGRVMGIIGVPMLLGPVLGPVIGGLLIEYASWRWIFYVNIPIGAVALAFAWRLLPRDEPRPEHRLDWKGLVLLSPGLALLVYALSEVGSTGDVTGRNSTVAFFAGVVLLGVFTWHSFREGDEALVDLRLFGNREFSASSLTGLLFAGAMFGAMILLPLYYQIVRGGTALEAGLLMAPQGLGAAVMMPVAGKLTDRLGAGRVVPFGIALAVIGTAAYVGLSASTSFWFLGGALFVRGLGMGASMMPSIAAAYQTMPPRAIPRATALINVVQRVGGSFGTALFAVVLVRRIHAHVAALHLAHAPSFSGQIQNLPPGARQVLGNPVAHAFGDTFLWATVMMLLMFLPAAFLPRHPPDKGPAEAGAVEL